MFPRGHAHICACVHTHTHTHLLGPSSASLTHVPQTVCLFDVRRATSMPRVTSPTHTPSLLSSPEYPHPPALHPPHHRPQTNLSTGGKGPQQFVFDFTVPCLPPTTPRAGSGHVRASPEMEGGWVTELKVLPGSEGQCPKTSPLTLDLVSQQEAGPSHHQMSPRCQPSR